jgi:hypothetical protein
LGGKVAVTWGAKSKSQERETGEREVGAGLKKDLHAGLSHLDYSADRRKQPLQEE